MHTTVAGFLLWLHSGECSGRASRWPVKLLARVAVLALLAHGSSLFAVPPANYDRVWREDASPGRLVFIRPPQEKFCLLSGPARVDADKVLDARAWSGTNARPLRLVWSDTTNTFFLIDCQGVPEQRDVAVYLLTNAVVPISELAVCDPLPVRFYSQRTAGQDLPVTRAQMKILDTRVDRSVYNQSLATFEAVGGSLHGWYRGDWQRKNHLVQLSSWVLFPVTGDYAFYLSAGNPVWLTVDDVPVLDSCAILQSGATNSIVRKMVAGLHYVVARGVAQQNLRLSAGWTAKGKISDAVAMAVTGNAKVSARWERRDHSLHAFGMSTTAPAYTFAGTTNVFTPVTLVSQSVARDGSPFTCTWRPTQVGAGQGACILPACMHLGHTCLAGVGSPCKITLCAAEGVTRIELTVADSQGHTDQDIVPILLDGQPRVQYRVQGQLAGVPAMGYGEDPVRPEIHIRATSPDEIDFTVEATVEYAKGGRTNISALVNIERAWGRFVLPTGTADAFKLISWQVLHGGVVLDHGSVMFDHAPFQTLPDALNGNMLHYQERQLMLVARQASAGKVVSFNGVRPRQRLLLLDGFLATDVGGDGTNLTAHLDRALSEWLGCPLVYQVAKPTLTSEAASRKANAAMRYQRLNLRAMETADTTHGLARLHPLAQIGALLPADVVVLALPFDALGQGESLAQYERRLATWVGLLTGPGHAVVVLVTPPPFAILPGCEALVTVGVHPPETRQLAEIVCRVADAYGMPVADLFTQCMTSDPDAPLIRSSSLTSAGLDRALETLRLVLCGKR